MSARCKLGSIVASEMNLATGSLVDEWTKTGLDHRGVEVSARKMHAALLAAGYSVGVSTVKEHRAGTCSCSKEQV